MKHFFVITNEKKDTGLQTTLFIQSYLSKHGAVCELSTEHDEVTEGTQCILVLGGDGTLLQAARDTFGRNIPLIGVNLGTVGFMAEVEKNHIKEALDALIADQFTVEERMMLDGSFPLHRQDTLSEPGAKEYAQYEMMEAHALNDIVLTRQGGLKVLTYEVFVNGQFLNQYHADGVIISTPTGSTGYNMSAGGPIVEPKAKLLLLTPICPHTLSPRSIILAAEDQIEIKIGYGRNGEEQEAFVNFDGSVAHRLTTGDVIRVSQSRQITYLLRISQAGFLENLHNKMG